MYNMQILPAWAGGGGGGVGGGGGGGEALNVIWSAIYHAGASQPETNGESNRQIRRRSGRSTFRVYETLFHALVMII
jgi:hypothetical protein